MSSGRLEASRENDDVGERARGASTVHSAFRADGPVWSSTKQRMGTGNEDAAGRRCHSIFGRRRMDGRAKDQVERRQLLY